MRLPWAPLTLFIDFNEAFIEHSSNFLAYANLLNMDGELVSVRLPNHETDKRHIIKLIRATHQHIATLLTQSFTRLMPTVWHHDANHIRRWLSRYRHNEITVERLIDRLTPLIAKGNSAQQAAFAKRIEHCWAIARQGDQALTAFTQQAFMITRARNVNHSDYSDDIEAYRTLKTLQLPNINPKLANDIAYQQALYAQFLMTEKFFKAHQFPLYAPRRQADWDKHGQPYWQPSDRDTYDRLGLIPSAHP